MTPRPPPSPNQSVGELALRCKRLSARRPASSASSHRRPRVPPAPIVRAGRRAVHRERRARRARARSPRGSALFHPVAQRRVEHRVIGPGRGTMPAREPGGGGRGRITARRPVVALARRLAQEVLRADQHVAAAPVRLRADADFPTKTSGRLRPVCPRARRHFKVRVANTPAARRRGAEVDVELGRQRHELRGQRRGAQPRRGLAAAFFLLAPPSSHRSQGPSVVPLPLAPPSLIQLMDEPHATHPRLSPDALLRFGGGTTRPRAVEARRVFADALPEARDRVLVPGAVRLRDDRGSPRGARRVRGGRRHLGTPSAPPSGAATTTVDILTGDSTTLDSNSPCSPSAFHLHILSLQLMHEDRAPRPGLSLAAPGRCAPTPNSASVAPGPSAAPVSSLAPVLPAPRLAAVLARLLTRGTAVDAFVASSEVRALNIDASPHGDCDTYMCTLTPGRSEHHGRVRSRAIAPPTIVFSERSGRKMETRGFSSARVRPAATSLSISSYMYSTSALRARTSACESASARPSEHRRSAPRHFVPVPSATTTGGASGVRSSVRANPASEVYSCVCGLPFFGRDAYLLRTASATAAGRDEGSRRAQPRPSPRARNNETTTRGFHAFLFRIP